MRALGMANRTARVPVPQTPKSSDGSGGPSKPKHKKPSHKNNAKEASSSGVKYRDRATERRQGVNPDYIETEQILSTLEEAAADVAPDILYEQSKFLGGDREHTHLVKGLDYALLHKVRQEEMEQGTETADLDQVFESVEKATKTDIAEDMTEDEEVPEMNSALARNVYKYAIEEPAKKPPKVNELFVPGRTVFIFEVPITSKLKKSKAGVVEDNNPFAVPTIVVRSRADVDQQEAGTAENAEADMVMNKVMNILQAIRMGERKVESEAELKAKRKAASVAVAKASAAKLQDEEEVLPQVEPDEDGDDIFADAGREYVVEAVLEEPAKENAMEVDDGLGPMVGPAMPDDVDMSHYYNDDSDNEQGQDEEADQDGEEPLLGPVPPSETDMAGYYDEGSEEEGSEGSAQEESVANEQYVSGADMESHLASTESESSRRKPELDDIEIDEDADYYSAYGLGMRGGLGSTAYDSDEDEGEGESTILIDKGTHKNKRAQLGRFDFDTEEGFNRYKDTVEVVPKTSFQYGVKMSDGRKTGKWDENKGKGLTKDQKLDRDWQRISRIMGKKGGGGGQKSKGEDESGGDEQRNKRRKNNNW